MRPAKFPLELLRDRLFLEPRVEVRSCQLVGVDVRGRRELAAGCLRPAPWQDRGLPLQGGDPSQHTDLLHQCQPSGVCTMGWKVCVTN